MYIYIYIHPYHPLQPGCFYFFFRVLKHLKRPGSGHGRFGHCRSSTMLDLPRGLEILESPNVGHLGKTCGDKMESPGRLKMDVFFGGGWNWNILESLSLWMFSLKSKGDFWNIWGVFVIMGFFDISEYFIGLCFLFLFRYMFMACRDQKTRKFTVTRISLKVRSLWRRDLAEISRCQIRWSILIHRFLGMKQIPMDFFSSWQTFDFITLLRAKLHQVEGIDQK